MIMKILKKLEKYKNKNGNYPKAIYISKKNYTKLIKELSQYPTEIIEEIKILYLIDYKIIEEEKYE